MNIKRYQKYLLGVALVASLFVAFWGYRQWQTFQPKNQTADVSDIQDDMVLLGGMPVGIYMETDGVLVLGTGTIEGKDGNSHQPSEYLVKPGDYITAINQTTIESKKELIRQIQKLDEKEAVLTIRRNGENLQIKVETQESKDGTVMLGIWVRDDVQGLGTITYIKNHTFAALGHGIHDTDISALLNIKTGTLYRTNIRSISKSTANSPGSMEGIIVYNKRNELGMITANKETGIYGTIENPEILLEEKIPIAVAKREEIEVGDATIRCMVSDTIKEYKIRINELDMSDHEINKGMTIEITDPELLELTGGIVQGMSGSPIIQNGKLVGAVTHVFIKDSKKGYGIFIENMM